MSLTPQQQEIRRIMRLPENRICADCSNTNPSWASLPFGICICLECSGKHRGLGTHISFVRSLELDNWTDDQVKIMRIGGNRRIKDYFKSVGIDQLPISQKYTKRSAYQYAKDLYLEAGVEFTNAPPPPPRSEMSSQPQLDPKPSMTHSKSSPVPVIDTVSDDAKPPMNQPATRKTVRPASKPRGKGGPKKVVTNVFTVEDEDFDDLMAWDDDSKPEIVEDDAKYEEDQPPAPKYNQSYGYTPPVPPSRQERVTNAGEAVGEVIKTAVTEVGHAVGSVVSTATDTISPYAAAAWSKSKDIGKSFLSWLQQE